MSTDAIIVPLKEIVADPDQDVDLTAIPRASSIALIWKGYRFLLPEVEVTIKDGMVTMRVPELEAPEPSPQGATDPALLAEKMPATALYLHSALKRFARMTDEQVLAIGKEIALRGWRELIIPRPNRRTR